MLLNSNIESVVKQILKHIGNNHTKVERKQGFMGNYYSPLIDTIYIAENFESAEIPKDAKSMNRKAAELIVLCHECVHSVQNKCLHILNTIFANISMILSFVCILMALLGVTPLWLKISTIITLMISITVRLVLEIGAINGSIKVAGEIVKAELIDGVSTQDIEEGEAYIKKHKLFAALQMILDKIIFLLLVLVIK